MRKLLLITILTAMGAVAYGKVLNTPQSQMEKLNRGLIVVPNSSGNYVSWRMFGTDNSATTFKLYYDGALVKTFRTNNPTCYVHSGVTGTGEYKIVAYQDGVAIDSMVATKWGNKFLKVPLKRPTGSGCTYTPNDCSAADVDGDGEYEIIMKWDPSNAKDNSQDGKTGNVYIDCYKLNGKHLWRVDLGPNIRAGAHYTQFLVFDFDKDGKAEMICKTAPGSKDAAGKYISEAATLAVIKSTDNTKDYRNSAGHILNGPEYLTVFEGETGNAVNTVFYNPNRAGGLAGAPSGLDQNYWGDNYGNRSERYLSCVSYIDGPDAPPCAIMVRGYYTRAFIWAVRYQDKKLVTRWLHHSRSETTYELTDSTGTKKYHSTPQNTSGENTGYRSAWGQGAHGISTGDVDGDGCDEIIFGAAAINNDGNLMYCTGLGHGDALHLGDLDPDRPGLEVFMPHESFNKGDEMHDAATGKILFRAKGSEDNARGIAADINSAYRGYEVWSSKVANTRTCKGEIIASKKGSQNFRVYWDGDVYDELLDGTIISKCNSNTSYADLVNFGTSTWNNAGSCNGTKSTPCLSADIFGDWREEVLEYSTSDYSTLNIYTTTTPTKMRVPTLMHDNIYRLAIAWQQCSYNQPPHLGYYLPDFVSSELEDVDGTKEQTVELGNDIKPVVLRWVNCQIATVSAVYHDGVKVNSLQDVNLSSDTDTENSLLTITGKPTNHGKYEVILKTSGDFVGTSSNDTITIIVPDPSGIETIHNHQPSTINPQPIYNLNGMRVNSNYNGIVIRQGKKIIQK